MTAQLAWLIDTNVVSEMMRPRPEPRVAAFLDSIEREGIGLASVTVWEILDGIGRLSPGRRRENLATRLHDLLDELFEDRIVDWSLADARACARIMEHKRRRGDPLDDHVPDAFLAAAAASRGLAVVTRDTGEFPMSIVHDAGVECPRRYHACVPGTEHEFGTERSLFPARQRAGTRGENSWQPAAGRQNVPAEGPPARGLPVLSAAPPRWQAKAEAMSTSRHRQSPGP